MIDLEKAKSEFERYTSNYDKNIYRISSKYSHSYRVMSICEEIATRLGLSQEEIELAQLIGLLHDIARFDQWVQFETFSDSKSFNHAEKAVEILKDNDYLRWYIEDAEYDDIILKSIENHNKFIVEYDGMTEKEQLFTKIVRDADKIDILYEATEIFWPEDSDVEEINNSYVSKEYYLQVMERKQIKHKDNESPLDKVAIILGLIFDINFRESKEIVIERDYINKIYARFHFKMDNSKMQMGNIKDLCDREIRK